jgi:uncharacterized protein
MPGPLPVGPWTIRTIALDLSGRCNLACRYCSETATQPPRQPMSIGMLDRVWAWFRQVRHPSSWSVHMGSGEPLLALDLLKHLDQLVRADLKAGDPVPVSINTNATCLDPATADWIAGAGWNVKISFDGPKAVHDRWRVAPDGTGTFDRVERAASGLAGRLGDRLTLNSVLCRGTDPFAVFEAVRATGARRMDFRPVAAANPDLCPDGADLVRYAAFISEYARTWRDGDDPSAPVLVRFSRFVVRATGYHGRRVGCGAGREYVGVGPDGALYPCMRFVGLPGYEIGRLPAGIDPAPAQAFERGPGRPFDRRDACGACWAAPLCAGPCFASAEMFALDHHCAVYRAEAAAAVRLVRQLREQNPARLLTILGSAVVC